MKEKLSVGRSGALALPLSVISLAGLSSIVTSCTAFGGVTGRADANAKGLLETSAVVVLGVAPKLNADGAAGGAVEAVEEPNVKPVAGFSSAVEDVPKENGLVAGFSSAGAVLGRWNENGVAGGGVPNRVLDLSVVCGAVTAVGTDDDAAAGAG